MRCADCRYFNHKYTNPVRDEKTGQMTQMKSGMCRYGMPVHIWTMFHTGNAEIPKVKSSRRVSL